MSFKTPKTPSVQKTQDPLINLAETSGDVQTQRNKKGLLSTFLQGSRNPTSGMLGQVFKGTTETLGKSVV